MTVPSMTAMSALVQAHRLIGEPDADHRAFAVCDDLCGENALNNPPRSRCFAPLPRDLV